MNEPEPWYMRFAGEWWKQARWYGKQRSPKSDNIIFICEIQNTSTRSASSFWLEFESFENRPDFLVAFRIHEFGRCAFREAVWTAQRRQSLFSADPEDAVELFTVPKALTNQAGQSRQSQKKIVADVQVFYGDRRRSFTMIGHFKAHHAMMILCGLPDIITSQLKSLFEPVVFGS